MSKHPKQGDSLTTATPAASASATTAQPAATKSAATKPVAAKSTAKPAADKPTNAKSAVKSAAAKSAVKPTTSKPAAAARHTAARAKAVKSAPAATRTAKPAAATDAAAIKAKSRATSAVQAKPATMPLAATAAPACETPPSRVKPRRHSVKKSAKLTPYVLILQKLGLYAQLMRLHKPIGILLLLWPTLWALWLAAKGVPSLKNVVIFSLGVVLMRSAGCVINDVADRKIDGRVSRTQDRPLARGLVSPKEALALFAGLCVLAFILVLQTNSMTVYWSVGALILASAYPFMKRYTQLPQLVLGAAFAWSIPMAFAAQVQQLPAALWLLYMATLLWTLAYDTFYAMVDRDEDVLIGVKSTAILFGENDRVITAIVQAMCLYCLVLVGARFELGAYYYGALVAVAGLFGYQQWLIRFRARSACFKAFSHNHWVGACVFAGIALHYGLGV